MSQLQEKAIDPISTAHPQFPERGEPTWEVAFLYPTQGCWSEQDYMGLEDHCGGHIRVELVHGRVEVLPMPTENHQDIIAFLLESLHSYIRPRKLGKASFSGIRVRLKNGADPQFRQPDIAFIMAENAHRRHDKFWEGADLVMEVVSGDAHDIERDYVEKKKAYAEADIAEYWIVDPREARIIVYTLRHGNYQVHGEFQAGAAADSPLLPGFTVAVNDVLSAGN